VAQCLLASQGVPAGLARAGLASGRPKANESIDSTLQVMPPSAGSDRPNVRCGRILRRCPRVAIRNFLHVFLAPVAADRVRP
jgi:hypothetical protein